MVSRPDAAQAGCDRLARTHYENFPVASIVLPRRLRQPIAVIYAFARTADDIADEGDADATSRLTLLADYGEELHKLERGQAPQLPLFVALGQAIREHDLPFAPFHDLLAAFRQDVTKTRYADFDDVLAYCRLSANPVGRLLLHLYRADTAEHLACSDRICTALQLINFLQDIEVDLAKGRVYLPQNELLAAGLTERDLPGPRSPAIREFLQGQIGRARDLLCAGAPLGRALPGRIGFEMRFIIAGGLRVADKLAMQNARGEHGRARLTPLDWVRMLGRAATGIDCGRAPLTKVS
jgi:squalene synthase HpnC